MTRPSDFWSRRREGVAREAEQEAETRAEAEAATARAALEERPDEEILAELGLPDPDLMQRGDDFAAFMGRTVPERLRRRALRRLWRSDPVLANLDGLNNYDTDFRHSDIPGIAVTTAYQVGKGFARSVTEAVAALGADEEAGGEADGKANEATTGAGAALEGAQNTASLADQGAAGDSFDAGRAGEAEAALPQGDDGAFEDGALDGDEMPAPRRRMRFDYAG